MNNWKSVQEYVQFSTKGITPKYVEKSSIMVLNQKCIRNNRIDYSLARFTDDSKNIPEHKFVKKGDILFNSTGQGTAGRCTFVDKLPKDHKLVIDSHILLLRCKSFFEAKCLNYTLFSFEKTIQSFMDGSTGQGELDKVRLFNILVKLPEIPSNQKNIATTLSNLDNKIELNNKINAELEAMAKLIYDYWFVQFDFPDKNGKPYKSSGGKMVFNEELKREIPEGSKDVKLRHWIDKDKNGDWGKETKTGNYTSKVRCIRGADINGLNGKGKIKAPTRFILKKNNHKILEPGDLIIEISGGSPTQSTGRLAFIIDETLDRFEVPLICSNFCKAATLKNKKSIYNFVLLWNRLYDAGVLFGWEGKTSGIKNLLFESFISNYNVVFPEEKLIEDFYEKVNPIYSQIQKNLKQNKTLSSLRDWLLPMLMNGQVQVGE